MKIGSEKIPVFCACCGKHFMKRADHVASRKSGRAHCSRECFAKARMVDGAKWRDEAQIAAYMREYTVKNRERLNVSKRLYAKLVRETTPEKRRAREAVNNAIRDRKLNKQPCYACGAVKAEAHHENYSKPLDVTWLCRRCHKNVHAGKLQLLPQFTHKET